MLIACLFERGLHSSDRFLYNCMINLLLYWQSILEEWLKNNALYISCVCMCACVCVLFFVPTDIQKSNNVKLVQSSVPLGPTKVTLLLCLPLLDVATVVVNCVCCASLFLPMDSVNSSMFRNPVSEELASVSIV